MTTHPQTSVLPGTLALQTQKSMHLLRKKAIEAPLPQALTLDQWLVLDALRGSGQTMTDLAERTCITGPTLTRIIDRLVSIAAVYRELDAGDRRKVRVHLSARGRGLHEQSSTILAAIEDDVRAEVLGC